MEKLTYIALIFVAVLLHYVFRKANPADNASRNLPPGPKGLPWIGNAFQLPQTSVALTFLNMAKTYGEIFTVSLFGQRLVLLNTYEAAMEVLGTKGEWTAGRPHLPMASALSGYDRFIAMMQPGETFNRKRRYLSECIGPRQCPYYSDMQQTEVAVRLLRKLYEDPDNFESHFKWIAATNILMVNYGYASKEDNDPIIRESSEVMKSFGEAAAPGRWIVDMLPILQYVPSWLPGAGFKRFAKSCRRQATYAFAIPLRVIKEETAVGLAKDCLATQFLSELENNTPEQEEFLTFTLGDMFGASIETLSAVLSSFILAMVMYPGAQRRAQEEIDAVCDNQSRLPTHEDKPLLPYTEALVLETLRWAVAAPLGLSHCATKDLSYRDYHIPRGTQIFANLGAIQRDPEMYPDPDCFEPERHLGPPEARQPDPRKMVFGFGRRICSGNVLAEQTLFILFATMLATFDIRGRPGETYEVSRSKDSVISHNLPFQCDIVVRSSQSNKVFAKF